MAGRRWSRAAAVLVIAVACSPPQPPSTPNPAVRSAARALCEANGGSWHQTGTACTRTVRNVRPVEVELSADYPRDLLDDPTAGPPLRGFVTAYFTRFGTPDDELIHDGGAELRFETFRHAPDVESIVFTNVWYLGGAHPNNEVTTFTFDFASGKRLALADLFCEGIDPLTALPPLARPYVQRVVTQGIEVSRFDPKTANNYADDYRAWYLDGSDLVLVMPAARNGPAGAGLWQPRIPLEQLHSVLRGRECTA